MSGRVSYEAGLAAEDIVARHYARLGCPEIARRWRGEAGEIDLVLQDGEGLIFVEVKKSRSHAGAAARLSQHQMARIYNTGAEFLAGQPRGQLTDVRFDVAMVDGTGALEIIENAFGQF